MSRKRKTLEELLKDWLQGPQPIERLLALRILVPLAVLGFMSSRLNYADHWIGSRGFSVPDLGGDWRQPLYLPPLPDAFAWLVAALMVASGLATALGFRTRLSAALFGATLIYVALADRLAAFTVSKISPVIALTLACSAAGARFGIDAWQRRKSLSTEHSANRPASAVPTHAPGGPLRFVQLFLPVFYCASGICKARGDWLERWDVLWTHLHDSYQTPVSYFLANHLPATAWPLMQVTTLAFEVGAPLWFAWSRTRHVALGYGLAMHALIGLMFGPVIWFSLLMMILLFAAYAPLRWVQAPFEKVHSIQQKRPSPSPGNA